MRGCAGDAAPRVQLAWAAVAPAGGRSCGGRPARAPRWAAPCPSARVARPPDAAVAPFRVGDARVGGDVSLADASPPARAHPPRASLPPARPCPPPPRARRWVWIVDEVDAFVPAKVLTEHADGSKEVEIQRTHEIKTVKKADIGPYITRVAELKNHVDGASRRRGQGGRRRPTVGRALAEPLAHVLLPHLPAPRPLPAQTWCAWAT